MPRLAKERIVFTAAFQSIVAGTTKQSIDTSISTDKIIANSPHNFIVTGFTKYLIVSSKCINYIVARRSMYFVIGVGYYLRGYVYVVEFTYTHINCGAVLKHDRINKTARRAFLCEVAFNS